MVELDNFGQGDEWEAIPQVDGAEGDAKVWGKHFICVDSFLECLDHTTQIACWFPKHLSEPLVAHTYAFVLGSQRV